MGEGGCRGLDWNRKGCPKFVGRVSLAKCGQECGKVSYCSAFHVLKHDEKDDTYECFLFGHKDVVAVKSLGGTCYALKAKQETEDEQDIQLGKSMQNLLYHDHKSARKCILPDTPVKMIEIGPGMCRGQAWQQGKWPVDKGTLTAQECADACAKKKGCTAFDLSNGKGGKKFACFLYGHKDVEPAKALKGHCYTYKGNTVTEELANEQHLDEIEDQEDEKEQGKSRNLTRSAVVCPV